MTDEQIIKALECCASTNSSEACRGCPFDKNNICEKDSVALQKYALDLINRQKAEIERLQKEKFDSLNSQFAEMYATTLKIATKNAKSEAIKEFAERLKEKASRGFWAELAYVDVDDIDNLVKEMLGDAEESSETKKSKWEIDCDGYYPYCPNCGEEPPSGKMTNFCPKCGKDMRGDK